MFSHRIDSGALRSFGLTAAMRMHDATVHGRSMVETTDRTTATWGEFWGSLRHSRDYSPLSDALTRVSALHPFCAYPEAQRSVFHTVQVQPQVYEPYIGTQLHAFDTLPEELTQALMHWRMGWLPLKAHLDHIHTYTQHGTSRAPHVKIVDFSNFQIDPATHLHTIAAALTAHWGKPTATHAEAQGATAFDRVKRWGDPKEAAESTTTSHNDDKFTICASGKRFQSGEWDAWYGKPCFDKVEKSKTVRLLPTCVCMCVCLCSCRQDA